MHRRCSNRILIHPARLNAGRPRPSPHLVGGISISSREITQVHPALMFPRSGTRSVPCRRKTRWRGGRGLARVSSRVPRVTIRAASPRIPGGFGGLRARRNLPRADRPRAEVATHEVVLWRDRDRHTRRHADQFTPVNPIKMPYWSAAISALPQRMSTRAAPHYLMRLSPARLPGACPCAGIRFTPCAAINHHANEFGGVRR